MKSHRIIALVLFLSASYLYITSLSIKYLPSIIFPRIILIVIAFLSVLLFLNVGKVTADKDSTKDDIFTNINYFKLIITIISTIIYVKMIEIIGFYSSTFIYLVWLLFYVDKKKIKMNIMISIGVITLFYIIFKIWLKIPTPIGVFI